MAEVGFITFYVSFFGLIALIGSLSGGAIVDVTGGDIHNVPSYTGGLLDALILPFQWIGYILGLQGLNVFGVSGVFSFFISLVFNVPMTYIAVKLARGGG